MRSIHLLRVLSVGDIGGLSLGATREQVRATFGAPEATGRSRRKRGFDDLWRYQDVEFRFLGPGDTLSTFAVTFYSWPPVGAASLRIDCEGFPEKADLRSFVSRMAALGTVFEEDTSLVLDPEEATAARSDSGAEVYFLKSEAGTEEHPFAIRLSRPDP